MKKHIACLVAGLTAGACFMRLSRRFAAPWLPQTLLPGITALILLTAIIYPFIYRRKTMDYAWINGLIRYAVAFDLATIGLQKIFGHQFVVPIAKFDEPFSSFSTEDHLWAFFGLSRGFVLLIAVLQMAGSLLLLFRRTQLLSIFILLPVMVNIMLLDYFYALPPGVLAQSSIITSGLIYLLLQEYQRLKTFFFIAPMQSPAIHIKRGWLKPVIRLSVIYLPLLLLFTYAFPDHHPEINGKYRSTGGDSLQFAYFDISNEVVLQFGEYHKRLYGHYQYDPANGDFQASWHYPHGVRDTLRGKLLQAERELQIRGMMGADSIHYTLHQIQ